MNVESGSMVSGKWINMSNNQVVNVTDTIIDESGMMIVMTDRGSIDMNTFSSNFIQCDDATIAEMTKNTSSTVNVLADEYILHEDITAAPQKPIIQEQTINNTNDSSSIIEKLFTKIESKPKIKIDIEWDEFPDEQVKMLINFLDVKKIDISRYIFDNYLDDYALLGALSEFLDKHT